MSVRESSRYSFGLKFTRFMPLNDDQTSPLSSAVDAAADDEIIGGAGPFDFSAVDDDSAVPITVKLDNADAVVSTIDVSGAVSQSAVTVDELVTALDAMFLAESLLLDASAQAGTGRLKIVSSDTADPPDYIQIYGQAAEIAMLGQGLGVKFIKTDTLKSMGDAPILKDSETFTTTDANGLDTEVITDGYKKGATLTIIDSAEDWELLELLEGGTYDDSVAGAESYDAPTSENTKKYFLIEAFYTVYEEGTNKKADIVGYVRKLIRTARGQVDAQTHELGFADGNYTCVATSYKNAAGALFGDTKKHNLTVTAWEALDVYNV